MTSATATSVVDSRAWNDYIEEARAGFESVGVAVAVVRGREVLYAEGFGVREVGTAAPIDADTLFQIGSTTKAFAAAALGLLVDDGTLDWDDRVLDHLPEFRLQDPWLTRKLTIRDALAHRSGIALDIYPFFAIMDSDEAVRQLRYAPSQLEFRDSFLYNNLMYAAAGKVTEAASGTGWHQFVKQRLLQPLKMQRSGTSPYEFWDPQHVARTFLGAATSGGSGIDDARDRNVAMPHALDRDGSVVAIPWQSYDNAAAAGSLVSSVSDMANWVAMHLNHGRFEGRRVVTEETVRELHTTQNHRAGDWFPLEDATEGYTLGWWRASYHGHVHLAHSGGILGFPSYVALVPDRDLGVVVLSNGPKVVSRDYSLNKAIAFWLLDRLLGVPPRDWSGEFLSRDRDIQREAEEAERELRQTRLSSAPPSLPLERYVGTYEDENVEAGRLRVELDGDVLRLSCRGGGAFSAPLEHWHRDVFRLRPNPGVADVLDASGPSFQFATFSIDAAATVATLSALGATLRHQSASERL